MTAKVNLKSKKLKTHLHGRNQVLIILSVHLAINHAAATLVQVEILFSGHQAVLALLFIGQAGQQLVEDMEVTLLGRVGDYARFFQQIIGYLRT